MWLLKYNVHLEKNHIILRVKVDTVLQMIKHYAMFLSLSFIAANLSECDRHSSNLYRSCLVSESKSPDPSLASSTPSLPDQYFLNKEKTQLHNKQSQRKPYMCRTRGERLREVGKQQWLMAEECAKKNWVPVMVKHHSASSGWIQIHDYIGELHENNSWRSFVQSQPSCRKLP